VLPDCLLSAAALCSDRVRYACEDCLSVCDSGENWTKVVDKIEVCQKFEFPKCRLAIFPKTGFILKSIVK